MKRVALCGFASAFSLLSACGGGGGSSGVVSTPTPPSSLVYPTFTALSANQQIPITGVFATRTTVSTASGDNTSPMQVASRTFSGGNLSITYDATTKSYTLVDGSFSSAAYGPDNLMGDNGFESDAVIYLRGGGTNVSSQLTLYKPEGNAKLGSPPLSYTTLFAWGQSNYTNNSDGTETTAVSDIVYGVGGFQTAGPDMPKTGSATYSGPVMGMHINGTEVEAVTGQAFLEANFGANTADARMLLNGATLGSTKEIVGSGSIDSNKFNGTMSGAGYSGAYDGAFNGPRAKEMGYSFSLSESGGGRIIGVGGGATSSPP